jgi:phosphatidylglycerol:prolipoprotein diacylglycerol transferase
MHPELLTIPFTGLTIKSYGTLMVIGFLVAVYVMRRLCQREGIDPIAITNAALYSLMAGIVGARIFYVLHYWEQFSGDWLGVFKIWRGGLEFLGGVVLAIVTMALYLRHLRLPVRRAMDVLAIGLMLGLGFGRIGCLLNGCCFGRPTDLPWGIRFPYNSFAYVSQINANPQRGRAEPQLDLPKDPYWDFDDEEGRWHPKPLSLLTDQQRYEAIKGKWRCLPVHPTEIYGSLKAFTLALILYLFWRRGFALRQMGQSGRWLARPGLTFGLMVMLYGIARFLLELLRDDNPYEWAGLTISQLMGLAMVVIGIGLILIMSWMRPERSTGPAKRS